MAKPAAQSGRDPTIYDVAGAAGVSPSTVSRVFSRPGRVNARTAEKVRAVAAELGYHGRRAARTRSLGPPRVLGLAVADITNPFSFGVIRGCHTAAAEAGFVVTLSDAHESQQREREMLDRTMPLVEGLVIAGSRLPDAELRSIGRSLPVVVLNRLVSGLPCIVPDVAHGIRVAADHLLHLGHRAIGWLAASETAWGDGMRWRSLRDFARERRFTEHRLGPVPPTLRGGRASAELVAQRKLRAVICHNDLMALGLMRGLQERGVRVPEDVSIVGTGNIPASALTTPSLTTIATPLTMLGEAAVRRLVDTVTGRHGLDTTPVTLPVRLVVRGSTGSA